MNKLSRIKLILAISLVMACSGMAKADDDTAFDGYNYTDLRVSSAQIFTGLGRIFAVYGSTDTSINGNYCQVVDTVAQTINAPWPEAFDPRMKSPPLFFASTSTIAGIGIETQVTKLIDYGSKGVVVSSGCFLYKTAVASGNARRCGIVWRK